MRDIEGRKHSGLLSRGSHRALMERKTQISTVSSSSSPSFRWVGVVICHENDDTLTSRHVQYVRFSTVIRCCVQRPDKTGASMPEILQPRKTDELWNAHTRSVAHP